MDIFDHDKSRQEIGSAAMGPPASFPSVSEQASAPESGRDTRDETVFSVLAGHARTRAPSHLWLTGSIGVVDAAALMIARPSLWWAASACLVLSAYATWGLADRALLDRGVTDPLLAQQLLATSVRGAGRPRSVLLRTVRWLAVVGGVSAAIAAMLGFLVSALGNSGPPG